jgi:hypothetical protein
VTAREKFTVNQRVRMTPEAAAAFAVHPRRAGVDNPAAFGTVRGFGREPDLVRVQRDGQKTVSSYSMNFWEPSEPHR